MDQTQRNTNRVVGTYGYMAPEYAMHGLYSIKSDVFSFGVLCLEIITGRRNSHFCTSDGVFDLLSHVWRYWTKGKVLEVVDPVLDDFPRNKAMQCIHIALLCVQEDAMIRPNMSSVVLMLSNYSTSVRVPSRPAFSFGDSEPNQPMLIESQPMMSAEDFTELEPR
ncbi:Cysteine-rich receptor-like protein kinase 10 [Acorus calamus]|uniref:Cysteine-rich receptor-like protein kinase 10 n=1 Tax=Acorus calamus TaxID=4465 RepID=A0AAV9C6U9_ACOCL|nr:Cysteine-rich receptor-like protein kinase 10 [Acorus calamus]